LQQVTSFDDVTPQPVGVKLLFQFIKLVIQSGSFI